MASVFDGIEKRSAYPVKSLPTVFVRELTTGESKRARKISSDDLRSTFILGLSVVNDSGAREWPQFTGESDDEYAARIEPLVDATSDAVSSAIAEVIQHLRKPVDLDRLEKKSAEIMRPDSLVTSQPE